MTGKKGKRGWGHIRKLPSGRFQASYIGPDGLSRYKAPTTYSTRMDAEGWLSNERRKIELDVWTPPAPAMVREKPKEPVLRDYSERWLAERTLKPRTRSGYAANLRLHINPILGDIDLRHITAQTIRSWYAGLGAETPTRNSHCYSLLHAICETAVEDGLMQVNPCTVRGAMAVKRKRQPIILDVPEVAKLADAMPDHLRVSVLLAAWAGLRWGETAELRRKDLDLDCVTLTVARAITRRDGVSRIDTTKGGEARTVVLPPHIRPDVRDHLDKHVSDDPEALLFTGGRLGRQMGDRVYREYFDIARKSIGRETLRVHDLRHFAGTQATLAGGSLKEVMARLGHSTVAAAMRYQGLVSGRDMALAEALSLMAQGSLTPKEDQKL
ncbi:site-specific integrase [Rhodococcus opacus]|uniref:site-specific integrase n=1 Tax=Rhodococcus opacus TaxID=37919 RepID=UPI0029554625|nr:site-specific integrase [Rhodococcus opacus]MDV7089488.1 site-specific integrase [Rhodococcus opacus]